MRPRKRGNVIIEKDYDVIVEKIYNIYASKKGAANLGFWKLEANRLVRTDKVSVDEAMKVLNWALKDDFWKKQVTTVPKFRERYKNIVQAMKEKQEFINDENL